MIVIEAENQSAIECLAVTTIGYQSSEGVQPLLANITSNRVEPNVSIASMPPPRTQCSIMTGSGRSAIAVIELSGNDARRTLDLMFQPASSLALVAGRIRYGHWVGKRPEGNEAEPGEQSAGESIVILPLGDDRFEIHCHGGDAASSRIIRDLESADVAFVDARRDAMLLNSSSGRMHRWIEQACEVLPHCVTQRTTAIVMDQIRGAMLDWQIGMLAHLQSSQSDADVLAKLDREVRRVVQVGRIGVRLTEPWQVVLAGAPNVGKSSLINALLGYDRAITMDFAGTTRDVLDAETVFDGWPVRLRDTAGLHRSDQAIEKQGMDRALAAIESADLVVEITEPGQPSANIKASSVLNVVNKWDLKVERFDADPQRAKPSDPSIVRTVATSGKGIEELRAAIVKRLMPEIPQPGEPVPISAQQLEWVQQIATAIEAHAENWREELIAVFKVHACK